MSETRVGIVMGSDSDWPVMKEAADALAEFDIGYEADVVSAHRMPEEMLAYGKQAADRGLSVIIAGAGGAAHLPGMLASVTPLPVIGVPVPLKHLDGLDSLLSIVQMPSGVPVATVAVGGARNAGLLAVRILAAAEPDLRDKMVAFQAALKATAEEKGEVVRNASGSSTAGLLTVSLGGLSKPRDRAGCAMCGTENLSKPRNRAECAMCGPRTRPNRAIARDVQRAGPRTRPNRAIARDDQGGQPTDAGVRAPQQP